MQPGSPLYAGHRPRHSLSTSPRSPTRGAESPDDREEQDEGEGTVRGWAAVVAVEGLDQPAERVICALEEQDGDAASALRRAIGLFGLKLRCTVTSSVAPPAFLTLALLPGAATPVVAAKGLEVGDGSIGTGVLGTEEDGCQGLREILAEVGGVANWRVQRWWGESQQDLHGDKTPRMLCGMKVGALP